MTNVVNVRRSNSIPRSRITTRLNVVHHHAAEFNLIVTVCAFGFRGSSATITRIIRIAASSIHVDIRTTVIVDCIRIVYAIHVNMYRWSTDRTRACITRTDARRKWSSSQHLTVAAQLAVLADRLCQMARWNARRSLATARRTNGWHVRATSTRCHEDGFARAEALANDSLESEAKVFGEKCINHGIYGAVAVACNGIKWRKKERRKKNAIVAWKSNQSTRNLRWIGNSNSIYLSRIPPRRVIH